MLNKPLQENLSRQDPKAQRKVFFHFSELACFESLRELSFSDSLMRQRKMSNSFGSHFQIQVTAKGNSSSFKGET
jgi:hypothetical protein